MSLVIAIFVVTACSGGGSAGDVGLRTMLGVDPLAVRSIDGVSFTESTEDAGTSTEPATLTRVGALRDGSRVAEVMESIRSVATDGGWVVTENSTSAAAGEKSADGDRFTFTVHTDQHDEDVQIVLVLKDYGAGSG